MRAARAPAAAPVLAIVLFSACSTGETQVQGGGTSRTGPTETGPTATGPTAATGGGLTGAVQLDLSAVDNPTGATMYSCDGVEGYVDLRPRQARRRGRPRSRWSRPTSTWPAGTGP